MGVPPAAIAFAHLGLGGSLFVPLASPRLHPLTIELERQAAHYAAVVVALFLAQS